MNPIRALAAIALVASLLAQAGERREDVIRVFRTYEDLNADFVRSVSTGTGKTGKTYAELRREVEAYGEGPFAEALLQAQGLICSSQDKELLASLVRVTTATSNSASEAPTETLTAVAKCRPAELKALGPSLTAQQRAELARRAPELKAVFK